MNKASVNVSDTASPSEAQDSHPLTPPEGGFNVSETRCGWCGSIIPEHRVKHAIRSKQPARWCRASCRVQASVARKRARLSTNGGA